MSATRQNLQARDIRHIIFLTFDGGPVKAIPFADGAINILSQPRKKGDFINLAKRLYLPSVGTVGKIKERLQIYPSSLKSRYILDNIKADKIHFWSLKDSHPLKVRCAPTMNWYMLRGRTSKWLSLFKWKRMASGWEGQTCKKSNSMGIHGKRTTACVCMWDAFSCHIVRKISLEEVQLKDEPCMLTSFGSQINPLW